MSRDPKENDQLTMLGPLVFVITALLIVEFLYWFVPA